MIYRTAVIIFRRIKFSRTKLQLHYRNYRNSYGNSLTTSSMVLLACCKTFVPTQFIDNLLTKAKDPRPTDKQSNVIYKVPCTCSKVYIRETKCRLGKRIKEHRDACVKYFTDMSAIAEQAWTNDHPINLYMYVQHQKTHTLIEAAGMSCPTVGSPRTRN